MIVRSLSSKYYRFKQLLNYFFKLPKEQRGKDPIIHNLFLRHPYDLKEVERLFLENSQHIRKKKSNTVLLFHEIIAFSPLDTQHLTDGVLQDIAATYLEKRAKNALAYGVIEKESDKHIHIHLLISGNLRNSEKKLTLSTSQFQNIKQELQDYTHAMYPQLKHSYVEHQDFNKQTQYKREKIRLTTKEQHREKRLKAEVRTELSRKEIARGVVLESLDQAENLEQFKQLLQTKGFLLYQRGQTWGIIDQEAYKYRFSTLGVQPSFERVKEIWQRVQKRDPEIQQLLLEKSFRELVEPLHYKEDILLALKPEKDQWDELFKEKREQERTLTSHNLNR
jgi:hypothetical protein